MENIHHQLLIQQNDLLDLPGNAENSISCKIPVATPLPKQEETFIEKDSGYRQITDWLVPGI